MIAHVITVCSIPESVEAAARCMESARKFGLVVTDFNAITPADGPAFQFAALRWSTKGFERNRYSRLEPCMACFLSHAALWRLCADSGEPLIVCEHDCIFVRPLPDNLNGKLVNLGKPSFGAFKQPPCGNGPFVSGPHLKGAHCYFLRPNGAKELLAAAKTDACPTDVFLSVKRFPWLREVFPWVAECHEEVSTIQREAGCAAKHRKVRIV